MNKKQIEQEFQKIDDEIKYNKPVDTPYPPDVIKRRELLLFAQVCLANVLDAKKKKNKQEGKLHEALYETMMSNYYGWYKSEQ
jgi:hypothetical protein